MDWVKNMEFPPRLIRLRDAAAYLGMDKNRFNAEVRPYVTEIPIGTQGIGFDRLDLDEWFEQYKARNGRPGKTDGGTSWDRKSHQDLSSVATSGMSRSKSEHAEFEKALARATSKKRNAT